MFKKIFSCIIPIFCLFTNTSNTHADVLYQKIVPVHISVKARGEGFVTIRLDKIRNLVNDTRSKFYQGTVRHRGAIFPVAADVHDNTTRITFPGKAKGSRKSRQRLYRITKSALGTRVSSVPSSFIKGKGCNTDGNFPRELISTLSVAENLAAVKVLTISTFSDAEWNNIHGALANHEIASIINTSEALYEQQLGIRFRIVSQATLQSIPANTSASTILNTFRLSGENTVPANAYHLFTGKDMEGSVIGIAYIGVICYAPKFAFGVTQYFGAATANIFSHEMGHNFGAQHDVASPGSLMYPSISFGDVYFSAKSVGDITTFLSYFGSCLTNENLPPSLHGATLKITRRKSRIKLVLLSRSGVPIENELINIQVNKRVRQAYTNASGSISFSVTKKKNTRVKIIATVVADTSITLQRRFTIR